MMRSFNESFHSKNKDLIIDSYDYKPEEKLSMQNEIKV
jgi:hypothetical protein